VALDRREFLTRAATLLGGAVSLSCSRAILGRAQGEALRAAASVLPEGERATLEAVVDRILPATQTPGALDAGVPDFVEFVLAEGCTEAERSRFREGLVQLERSAQAETRSAFTELPGEARDAMLAALEQAEMANAAPASPLDQSLGTSKPFFAFAKELTLVGFFTSELASKEVVSFAVWPGRFDGCIPFQPGQRAPVGIL
jgi:hypothetical protein